MTELNRCGATNPHRDAVRELVPGTKMRGNPRAAPSCRAPGGRAVKGRFAATTWGQ